jgi:hypothetical protein
MRSLVAKLSLVAAVAAAATFFTSGSGLHGAVGVASAAPFGLQAGSEADASSMVTLAKKGGKGKHHHHHGFWGVGGIIVGVGYCTARSDWCAERYGAYGHWYRRCMRRSGCYY